MSTSIILPAHDEAAYIGACLSALLASDSVETPVEVIVVANGCTDATTDIARGFAAAAAARGWALLVTELAKGGKLNALNRGDSIASGETRIYLDADVRVDPALVGQLVTVLGGTKAGYASGRPRLAPAKSLVSRAYGRFWSRLPFVTQGVPGFGIFAVNAAGRARWGAFPDIISDDTFVRLQFAASERTLVGAGYSWPMVEGFANLVRVRRRQDMGVAEITASYPALIGNDAATRMPFGALILRILLDPLGFGIYAAVALAVRSPLWRSDSRWARGR
jgi:glycosyltransferase involved in cell wall biosynthesis